MNFGIVDFSLAHSLSKGHPNTRAWSERGGGGVGVEGGEEREGERREAEESHVFHVHTV